MMVQGRNQFIGIKRDLSLAIDRGYSPTYIHRQSSDLRSLALLVISDSRPAPPPPEYSPTY